MLAVLKLYLLHRIDELVGLVVVDSLLFEYLIVEYLAAVEEKRHPNAVEQTAGDEDEEHEAIVKQQNNGEDDKGNEREGYAQRLLRQEVVHSRVVTHTLHEIPHEFSVEKRHGQFQKLDEEVAQQRDVDAHGNVEQHPPADEVDGCAAEGEHELAKQYEPDKAYAAPADAHIDDGLRQERQHELYQAAHCQAKYNLTEVAPVFADIAEEKLERPG